MASRVLVVDDHASHRPIARRVLAADGFTLVGEASGGIEAIRTSGDLRPDLLWLDVQLPDLDGFEVVGRVVPEVAQDPGQRQIQLLDGLLAQEPSLLVELAPDTICPASFARWPPSAA